MFTAKYKTTVFQRKINGTYIYSRFVQNHFANDNGPVTEARDARLRSVTSECVKGFLSRRELNRPAGGTTRLIVNWLYPIQRLNTLYLRVLSFFFISA